MGKIQCLMFYAIISPNPNWERRWMLISGETFCLQFCVGYLSALLQMCHGQAFFRWLTVSITSNVAFQFPKMSFMLSLAKQTYNLQVHIHSRCQEAFTGVTASRWAESVEMGVNANSVYVQFNLCEDEDLSVLFFILLPHKWRMALKGYDQYPFHSLSSSL